MITPTILRELLQVLKESGLQHFKLQVDADTQVEGTFTYSATSPLKDKLDALGSPPNLLSKFSNQPEVQYFQDTQSAITSAELTELGFSNIKPVQKKQARVVKNEE